MKKHKLLKLLSIKNDRNQGPLFLSELLPKTRFVELSRKQDLEVILKYTVLPSKKQITINSSFRKFGSMLFTEGSKVEILSPLSQIHKLTSTDSM